MRATATLVLALTTLACATPVALRTKPVCSEAKFPSLPDVRIVSVSAEIDLAPHCKVAGVIGTETNLHFTMGVAIISTNRMISDHVELRTATLRF